MDLARSIGVTRIARVTGLDRAGVEVACAVRPGGHVLQISNGKGETREEAAASALSEAAELWCAEHLDAAWLVWGSPAELRVPAISPAELPLSAPALWSERVRLAWRRARDLQGGPELLVPAQAVHCAPRGSPPLGPALLRWSSNGMGAHPFRERALQHALLEAIERDQLARALPHGFTPRAIRHRLLREDSLPPRTAARVLDLRARGFAVHLFDLAPGGARDLGLPIAGALLGDLEGGPVPLTAGYACRPVRDAALLAALLEAAQSRLTEVHGAREDVAGVDAISAAQLLQACGSTRATRAASEMSSGAGSSAALLQRLRKAGHARAAVVDLAPPGLGLHVVKVLIPGLLVSEML